MVKVLITERFSLHTLLQMQMDARIQVTHDTQWFNKEATQWDNTEILIIRSQTKVEPSLLKIFPKLKLIITATAGFNHIDLDLCQKHQIQVAHCPASHTASTAELTWTLILACARRLPEAQNAAKKEDWDRNKYLGTELCGKTIGIVGLGRVGSKVGLIAQAFGLKVMAFDPYQEDEVFIKGNVERVSLEELLTQSDIISLHVPLTKETRHMMGSLFLESISPHAILINTCRGPVIHENALIPLLQNKKIGALGLDVFEYEPLIKESPLFQYNNVITTPHIGASTREAFDKASAEAFEKVKAYLLGTPLPDSLPPQTRWYLEN